MSLMSRLADASESTAGISNTGKGLAERVALALESIGGTSRPGVSWPERIALASRDISGDASLIGSWFVNAANNLESAASVSNLASPIERMILACEAGFGALWTPSEITTKLWFDTSDESTITESGGLVSQLDDKSGNGYHASNLVGSEQPTTGTRTIGGLNVLDFDGNDCLEITDTNPLSIPATCYLFAVAQMDASGVNADNAIICASNGVLRNWGIDLDTDGTDVVTIRSGSTQRTISSAGTQDLAIWAQEAFSGNLVGRKTGNIFFNGTPSSANTSSDSLHIGCRDGSGNHFDGVIAEIIRVDASVDTDTRERIEGYLAWKWDGGVAGTLVGNLPSGHTYKTEAPTV